MMNLHRKIEHGLNGFSTYFSLKKIPIKIFNSKKNALAIIHRKR